MKLKEEPAGSDTAEPPDSSHSEHDASALDVSTKMDSSSTDAAGTSLLQESSVGMKSPDAPFGSTSQQMSPKQDVMPTSTSANMTTAKVTADEDGEVAAIVTESTESQVPASDNVVNISALSSPVTSMATSPEKAKNEIAGDSVDKVAISEGRSGTPSAVINKT